MRLRRLFAPLALFVALAPADARAPARPAKQAAKPLAHPGLWVVKDDDTTIYLFGTVHALPAGVNWFHGPVKAAFDASSELVIEMIDPDLGVQQAALLEKAVDPDGPALTEKLSAEAASAYRAAMASYGEQPAAYEMFDPWFVSNILVLRATQRLGMDTATGVETLLTRKAKAAGKPIGEIESFTSQIAMFDGLSEAAQIENLNLTVRDLPKTGAQMKSMINAWSRGDDVALAATVDEEMDAQAEYRETLITRRNAAWVGWIKQRLESPGTLFIAVGAGHLAGQDSVQAKLEAAGIPALRVNPRR